MINERAPRFLRIAAVFIATDNVSVAVQVPAPQVNLS
jgi:hypothetical protein